MNMKQILPKFNLKIYLDKEFKLDYDCEPEITIANIKLMLCYKLELFSINYIIEFKEIDITDKNNQSIKELCFVNPNIEEQEIKLDLKNINTLVEGNKLINISKFFQFH